jgi:GTP cyclohydrolase I
METPNHDPLLLRWIEKMLVDTPEAVAGFADSLSDNPGRITRAYGELLSGYGMSPEKILKKVLAVKEGDNNGLVSAICIPFLSFCAHHFLPFFGTIDIAYEPGEFILGIGKLPRLVDCHAKRFNLQELLVRDICHDLMVHAKAKGAYVRASAQHLCVCYRGPAMAGVHNRTSYAEGTCADPARIHEVLALFGGAQ